MLKTAEYVSLGHPDKIADYISCYILDRMLEQDKNVRYAVETMVKDNTIVLGGEICGQVSLNNFEDYIKEALREIGYDERYAEIWGENAIDVRRVKVLNFVGQQSCEIYQGVHQGGWGDQGVFVGYACRGEALIPQPLYLAKLLAKTLYKKARQSKNLGLDIKTQITMDGEKIETAIVAIPMLEKENLEKYIIETLGQKPERIIINGTGQYTSHSSIADCGITGRKLACDFYSAFCALGGGSLWGKDATKADVSLNILARKLAVENLRDNDEAYVYLSSFIGKSELPSAVLKTVKEGQIRERQLDGNFSPAEVISKLGLNQPVFAELCREGIIR